LAVVCPNCGSEQVQTVALAHAQNTSVVYDSRGRASGIRKTASGVMLEPPTKRRVWWRWFLFVGFVLGIFYSLIGGLFTGEIGAWISMVIDAALAYLVHRFVLKPARRYNREVFPAELEKWERSWTCNQCGVVFDLGN
jgi:hypothetical protein